MEKEGDSGPLGVEEDEPHVEESPDDTDGVSEGFEEGGGVTDQSDEDAEDLSESEGAEEEPQKGQLMGAEGSPQDAGECTEEDISEREEVGDMQETQEEVPSIDHEEVMRILHDLQDKRNSLVQLNGQLQARLAEMFRRKVGEEARPESQKVTTDPEQRYLQCMAIIEDLREQYHENTERYQHQVEQLQVETQEKLEHVEIEWRALQALKRDVETEALARRGGRQAAQAQVEQIQTSEQHREKELVCVRLENIQLRQRTQSYEAALRDKEGLAGGLHFIDFEQLKVENQTYGEKLEERSEELLRLRRKITNTVQALTHMREKLYFVMEDNEARRRQLVDAEAAVGRARDVLTHTKQARDSLRADNLRLRQRCGLLGHVTLLRDWEDKVNAIAELEERLDYLKRRHAELVEHCSSVKKKLQQAKVKD